MKRIPHRFHSAGREYVVLRKGNRPIVVDTRHLEDALLRGAESYPVVCNHDYECWAEMPEKHYELLEEQLNRLRY